MIAAGIVERTSGGQKIRLRAHELGEIMARFRRLAANGHNALSCYEQIAEVMGLKVNTVKVVVLRLRPTTEVAKDYLKSQALRLAMRVVREADANLAVGILSRPNIGVLDPEKRVEAGTGGIFLSVQADSCGAVKLGVAIGGSDAREIQPQGNEDMGRDLIEGVATQSVAVGEVEEGGYESGSGQGVEGTLGELEIEEKVSPWTLPGVPHPGQNHVGQSKKYLAAVAAAQARIAKAAARGAIARPTRASKLKADRKGGRPKAKRPSRSVIITVDENE